MRQSFWELATKFAGFYKEMSAINQLFDVQSFYYRNCAVPFTIKQYINDHHFPRWARANSVTAPSIKDLMQDLGVDFFDPRNYKTDFSLEEFLLYVETVYNLVSIEIVEAKKIMDVISQIRSNIKIDCARLGFEVREFGKEKYIIVEKNAAATAVADQYAASELEFSFKVIEYNHFLLRGNVSRKREILLALGQKFEEKRRQLELGIFKDVAKDAGLLLNKLDIRHNNASPDSKGYNAFVAQMSSDDLEAWYDKTYDILLLALLADDFSVLHKKVQELKEQMESK